MRKSSKLKLVVAIVLMASSFPHAGSANVSGNGSGYKPYLMGVVRASFSGLIAIVAGSPNSSFEEFANFTTLTLLSVSSSDNTS